MTYPTHAANQAGRDDPELRRDAPRALRARRLGPGVVRGADALRLAGGALDAGREVQARRPRHADASEEVASWKPGERLLLSGKLLTGRDAAHKRIQDMLAKGEKLPVDFTNRVIYYVGPVDPVRDEVVGPAGPTTATRMDKFTDMMLGEDRADRDDRQGRARPGGDRGDPQAQGGLPDGGRRRGLPGGEGDPQVARARASRTSAWKRSTSSR